MQRRKIAGLFVLTITLVSCHTTKMAVNTVKPTGKAGDYIDEYKDLAISEMKRTGVPASITLAQGMIESGMGKGTLAVEANNHFGIKCHDNWNGPYVRHDDDKRNECFRKYRTPAESFRDHSDFLRQTPRYSFLFNLPVTDYKGWARGLRKAGYATNPDYADMVIERIEKYELYRYDSPSAGKERREDKNSFEKKIASDPPRTELPVSPGSDGTVSYRALPERVQENNRIQYIVVRDNDTRDKIEKELNLLRWELPRYNELDNNFTPVPGAILYLQPKRDRAEPGKEIHLVKNGETMYQISQIYGIKIRKLYQMNRMTEGSEPSAGQKIYLRSVKPADQNRP